MGKVVTIVDFCAYIDANNEGDLGLEGDRLPTPLYTRG